MEVVRTDAEKGLMSRAETAAIDGPAWLKELQSEARSQFEDLGLPHRRVEEWKYTDLKTGMREAFAPAEGGSVSAAQIDELLGEGLSKLDAHRLVLVDGQFDAALSATEIAGEVEVLSLRDALASDVEWIKPLGGVQQGDRDGVQALNLALMQGGLCVRIGEKQELDKPLHLIFVASAGKASSFTSRLFFDIGRAAKVEIVESHLSVNGAPVQSNIAGEFIVGSWAEVRHVKFNTDHTDSVHLANVVGRLGQETDYKFFQLTLDGGITRNQLEMRYDGADAKADISGAALLSGKSHADLTLVMDHAATGCESRELFKTVLDDQARAVFQGKVIVQPGAQKTDGEMMSKSLLLSDDAEFDSKPELEIYADDVLCGHGATTGQIDDELLFYLKARGISDKEARGILIQAFFGEAMELIDNDDVREALIERAVAWYGDKK